MATSLVVVLKDWRHTRTLLHDLIHLLLLPIVEIFWQSDLCATTHEDLGGLLSIA